MSRPLRPLLPALGPRPSTEDNESSVRCRTACDQCRKAKVKCNGKRPVCGRCIKSSATCAYSAYEGESVQGAKKRKFDEIQAGNERLCSLLHKLQSASEQDAQEILRRLRQPHSDPLALARLLEDGDLLLQPLYTSLDLDPTNPSPSFQKNLHANRKKIAKLDKSLLDHSLIKVKSAPWTRVAPQGLVSHLLSLYFQCDNKGLCMSVDPERFLWELDSGDVSREQYCSRFLVNAICAVQSMFAPNCAHYDSLLGDSVQNRFFNEANRLSPNAISPSYVAAQGYLLLYFCCILQAKELSLDTSSQYSVSCSTQQQSDELKALSRAQWGLFNAHTAIAIGDRIPPKIQKPIIPRYFVTKEPSTAPSSDRGSNLLQLIDSRERLCLNAICDIQVVLYDCTVYSTTRRFELGSNSDILIRTEMHKRLLDACSSIPGLFGKDYEHSFCTWTVRLFYMMALVPIWRDVMMIPNLTPVVNGKTTLEILLEVCVDTVEDSWRHEARCGVDRYSILALSTCFTPPFILLNALDRHPCAPGAFTSCCKILHNRRSYGFSLTVLRGLRIIAKQKNLKLPEESWEYFEELEGTGAAWHENQVDFIPPMCGSELDLADGNSSHLVRLGELVTRWAQTTVS